MNTAGFELEKRIEAAIPRLLANHGLQVRVESARCTGPDAPDLWCVLSLDGHQVTLAVEVKSRWRQEILDNWDRIDGNKETTRLLVLPRISSVVRARLRQRGISHADLNGTLFLNAPGVRIDVDSRAQSVALPISRHTREVNPFSKKASLVLRVLLASPREPVRVSELVKQTGLAAGWASEVSDALVKRGYAQNSSAGVGLVDTVSTLRDWSAFYDWKKNQKESFVVPFQGEAALERLKNALSKHKIEWALTLLAGAQRRIGHVRFPGIHAYARPEHYLSISTALAELYAETFNEEGGITIMKPYYGRAAFFGANIVNGAPVVSDVQLFLDLAHFPVRGPEAAEMLIRRRLGPALSLAPNDMKRLLSDLA
jgi:hypothetical protein